jgi:glycosyltransferase involved in cell wall biosynthesis
MKKSKLLFTIPAYSPMKSKILDELVEYYDVDVAFPNLSVGNRGTYKEIKYNYNKIEIKSFLIKKRIIMYGLLNYIKNNRYDTIVVPTITDLVLVKTVVSKNTKILMWYGEYPISVDNKSFVVKLLNGVKKTLLKSVDGFGCYSNTTIKLLESYGIEKQKLFLVPQTIDFEYVKKFKKYIALDEPIKIIIVTQVIKRKRIDLIIDYLKRQEVLSKNFEITIVGGGDELENIKNQTLSMPQNIKINFTGKLMFDDVLQTVSDSHFLLFQTMEDIWGYVTNEGLTLGKPIIVSNLAVSSELIKNGYNGFKYNPNDYKEFIDIIKTIEKMDIETYKDMCNNAFNTSEEFHQNRPSEVYRNFINLLNIGE